MAAYAAAIAGAPLPIGLGRAESGSVNAAVLSYLASNLFKALKSPETKKVHRATLERFAAKYGSLSFRTLDKIGVERVLAKIAETPGAARNLRNVLRRMMKWAVAEGILASNPTEGIKVVMAHHDGRRAGAISHPSSYRHQGTSSF